MRNQFKIGEDPYRTWTATVVDQNRVRLPLEVREVIHWLEGEGPIDCIATPGVSGGLQVEAAAVHEEMRAKFIEALANATPRAEESSRKWVEASRLLATSWRMSIRVESSRFSITVPEPVRKAGLLPGVGGVVVAFGFGEILEIWDAREWHKHTGIIARTRRNMLSEAIEELLDR